MGFFSRLFSSLRTHRVVRYNGFAGVPGYDYCLSCGVRRPTAGERCPGRKALLEREAAKSEWWAHWEDHLAAGDLPPE